MTQTTESQQLKVFKYEKPAGEIEMGKVTLRLCKSDLLSVAVQVVMKEGGGTNPHSHTGEDEAWVILGGRAKFYDKDQLVGDLGPNEGIFIPKGAPCWFEPTEEPLEILRVAAKDKDIPDERVDYTPPTDRLRSRGIVGRAPSAEDK